MTTRLSWCAIAAALCLASSPLRAQQPDQLDVPIRFHRGRFVADRTAAKLTLSKRYRTLLRRGVTDAQLLTQFCDALDREFRLMPKPYFFTLTDAQKVLDIRDKLEDPKIETRRQWNGPIRDFPGLDILLLDRTNPGNFDEQLERVFQHSAIAEWLNPGDRLDRPLRFRVRDPLVLTHLQTPQTGRILDRGRVLGRLAPLDALPANPEAIRNLLLDFYTSRGMTPTIDVKLDATPPELSIFETTRIARILLPAELIDVTLADRIVYNAMPRRVFAAFRRQGTTVLAARIAADATKREVDLAALVAAAEAGKQTDPFELPPLDVAAMAEVQQRLLLVGYSASTFDFDPARRLVDVVIDATTPQAGAAGDTEPVTGAAETPPNSPLVSARPNAPIDVQPAPISTAPTSAPRRSANPPRREQKNFVGGGFEYRPGQGVRALGSFQRKKTMGADLLGVEGGGMGSGFGSGRFLRDYVLFDTLGRRFTVDGRGGSDFQQQRVLENVLTDERRTGGRLRLDLEALRIRSGHQWNVFLEGRRESVSLTPVPSNGSEQPTRKENLTAIDVGSLYQWRRALALHPLSVRIEPALRLALPVGRAQRFRRLQVGAQYHQTVAGPVEVESRFEARRASRMTPVFELPSLGGPQSVRGFRADETVGRHLWTLQSELWLPVLGSGTPSKIRDFVRRNVRVAAFYDAGRLGLLADGVESAVDQFRHGAGVGLRLRYQGVVIETDWGYGFGSDEARRPGRGRLYMNFRLP